MEKIIEVEARGLLNLTQKKKLENFLKKNGVFKQEKRRILIDYSLFLEDGGVRNRSKDIRLRITNGQPEIVVKIGKWGAGENRKELSVLTHEVSFDKLVEIFDALGYSKGALCVRNSVVYDYDDIEFAIVEVPGHSYYFEAEKMAHQEDDIDKIYKEIEKVCVSLGLVLFDDEAFMKYIETLNDESNEIFDFNNFRSNYFNDRFNL